MARLNKKLDIINLLRLQIRATQDIFKTDPWKLFWINFLSFQSHPIDFVIDLHNSCVMFGI